MKSNLKMIILSFLSVFLIMPFSKVSAFDKEKDNSSLIEIIQDELSDHDTSVIEELNSQIIEYTHLIKQENSQEKQNQLKQMISETQTLINTFTSKNTSSNSRASNYETMLAQEVAAVVAYFKSKGYKLAAELLSHAVSNKTTDSSYKPYYGYVVTYSPVFNKIANGTTIKGSSTFPSSSTTVLQDCYYAIHKFNYTKTNSNSNIVTIKDRYDYTDTYYEGIAGFAANAMKNAQDFKVIHPFYTIITCSND